MQDFVKRYLHEIIARATSFKLQTVENWQTQKKDLLTRQWGRNEFLTIFALAFVLGLAIKAVSVQFITIGYEDYTMSESVTMTTPELRGSLPSGPLCEE